MYIKHLIVDTFCYVNKVENHALKPFIILAVLESLPFYGRIFWGKLKLVKINSEKRPLKLCRSVKIWPSCARNTTFLIKLMLASLWISVNLMCILHKIKAMDDLMPKRVTFYSIVHFNQNGESSAKTNYTFSVWISFIPKMLLF